jgi:hypothetical protein
MPEAIALRQLAEALVLDRPADDEPRDEQTREQHDDHRGRDDPRQEQLLLLPVILERVVRSGTRLQPRVRFAPAAGEYGEQREPDERARERRPQRSDTARCDPRRRRSRTE